MKNPRHAALLCGLALWWGASAFANEAETMTLEQAIELALASDPGLAASSARSDATAARAEAADSGRGPTVDLEAGLQATDNPVMVFGQKLLQEEFTADDFALGSLNRPSFHEDFALRVVARQPLYTGGQIRHGIEAARHTQAGATALHEAARQQLVRSVTDRYTAAVTARLRVEVAAQAVDTARAHLELATSLFEGGLAVESDQLLAEVRAGELEEALLRARAGSAVATSALNLATGRAASEPVELETPDAATIDLGPPDSLEAATARALEQRPDLRALSDYHRASLSGVAQARALSRPTVGLEAGVEAHDPDFFGTSGTNASLMLGLRLPLFDGGSKKAQRLEAEAKSREARAELERLRDAVELEVRQAFLDQEAARKRVDIANKSRALAGRSLEIVEDRYRNGLVPLVDLLDAQAALTGSRLRVLEAERDALLARVALALATGDLAS